MFIDKYSKRSKKSICIALSLCIFAILIIACSTYKNISEVLSPKSCELMNDNDVNDTKEKNEYDSSFGIKSDDNYTKENDMNQNENEANKNSEDVQEVLNPNVYDISKKQTLVSPIKGKICILKHFSPEQALYSPTGNYYCVHQGIDIKTNDNEDIYAITGGEVINVLLDENFGGTVVINHILDGLELKVFYKGLKKVLIKSGDKVYPGQIIGLAGLNPRDEMVDHRGSFMHFGVVKDGFLVNPVDIFSPIFN